MKLRTAAVWVIRIFIILLCYVQRGAEGRSSEFIQISIVPQSGTRIVKYRKAD